LRLTETTGEALVDFIVDKTGRVVNAKVASATHPLFGERAVEAVRQWRFYPGRHNGVVVATHLQVPIIFQLGVGGGIDEVLMAARTLAEKLGPDIAADAVELRVAKLKRVLAPIRPGESGRIKAKVMLLLVLDADGNPIRGHILRADPVDAGPIVLQSALRSQFVPRVVNGMPAASNVVLMYTPPVDPSK
jgi:TonB family protein